MQGVHHGEHVGRHQFVAVGPVIARAPAVAPAVDHDRSIAGANQHRHLIPPVAGVAKATVEQDHGRPRPVGCVPDPGAVVLHIPLAIRDRQRRGALRFESLQIVVWFHIHSNLHLSVHR